MIIEVEIESWQLDCCGDPFSVGSRVTWDVHAGEPQGEVTVPRFFEDHHNGTDEDVPVVTISGIPIEIYAVSNRTVSVPGRTFKTNNEFDVLEEKAERAEEFHKPPDGYSHRGFRVLFEVADDIELPAYVESAWWANFKEEEREIAAKVLAFRSSEVGLRLSALVDAIADRFGRRVVVECSEQTTGVTILPVNPKSCTVRWTSFEEIVVRAGESEWSFESSHQGVDRLEMFIDAAASGRVRERVVPGKLQTIVTDATGKDHVGSVKFRPPEGRGIFIAGREYERFLRGDVDYEPW